MTNFGALKVQYTDIQTYSNFQIMLTGPDLHVLVTMVLILYVEGFFLVAAKFKKSLFTYVVCYNYIGMYFNPFPDKQLSLLGTVPKPVFFFNSLSTFCLRCEMISRRAARRLVDLHPKQSIEGELKRYTCCILCIKVHKNGTA